MRAPREVRRLDCDDPRIPGPGPACRSPVECPGARAAEHDGDRAGHLRLRAGKCGRDRNGRIQPARPGRGGGLAAGLCPDGPPGLAAAAALAAAVAGYLVVASTLGCLPAVGVPPRLGIALFAILSAVLLGGRLPIPEENRAGASLSTFQAMAVRTAIPATYVLVLGIVERMAGPGWAGLVSTFPSMSLVVLAVTHLEAGPAEASRIAKVLPVGNSSTLAFLAAFHFATTKHRPGRRDARRLRGRVAALLVIERNDQILGFIRLRAAHAKEFWRAQIVPWSLAFRDQCQLVVFASAAHTPRAPRYLVQRRPRHRGRFAPRVESLVW